MVYTAEERVDLIQEWSEFFMNSTEGWFPDVAGALGAQLAYLFSAIADNGTCNFQVEDEIIQHLISCDIMPNDSSSIWNFIEIEEND